MSICIARAFEHYKGDLNHNVALQYLCTFCYASQYTLNSFATMQFVYQMCGKAEWINGLLLAVPAFLKTVLAFPVAHLADTGSKERLIKAGTWIGITSVVMTIAGLYLMANITPLDLPGRQFGEPPWVGFYVLMLAAAIEAVEENVLGAPLNALVQNSVALENRTGMNSEQGSHAQR